MKRQFVWLVFFALFGIQSILAQAYLVKGNVTAKVGNEPLIGVTVLQKGSTNGVVTDMDGNYVIQIRGGEATLVFSYIGMKSQEFKVNSKTNVLNVVMRDDSQLMDEVVVVAYGVRKKGTIAGSVSTVKSEKLENVPSASFDQALQGQTPGMMVMSNSGEPSAPAKFQIRGTNSINSGTEPLYILDGVPISSSDFNTISPSDIESVSVLKDASSTSIYGARAANGVVVVTTKRGRAMEKPQIVFRSQIGLSSIAHGNWNLMNTEERIQFEKEVGFDHGQDYESLRKIDINWLDEVFRQNALLQNYDLSVSSATDKLNYFVSGSFYDQEGIALSSDFRRYNLRANADVKAAHWLKVGTNSMIAYEEVQQAPEGGYNTVTPISAAHFMLPYWNPYRKDGSVASAKDGSWKGLNENPLEWVLYNKGLNKKYKALSVFYAEVTPIKNLVIRSQFGVDYTHSTGESYSLPSYISNNGLGSVGRNSYDMLSLTITNTANYRWTMNDIHSFNVMLGQEGVDFKNESFDVITKGQNNDMLTNLSSGTWASAWGNSSTAYGMMSFFMRGEYDFNDRIYADFSVRADASSRFGKDNRWGAFWSVGLMWNVKKEKFLKNYDWLTNAQIAVSTGTSGNSTIPDFDHIELVGGGAGYMNQSGLTTISQGNENLGWEKTWSNNLAFHLGFQNRYNVDLEFYHKRTSNLLMSVPQSYVNNGYGFYWDNVGTIVNSGVELSGNFDVIRTKDFSWNLNANVSYNHNEIKELYNGVTEFENSNSGTKFVVGHSIGEFYTNRFAGVNPANGDALWYDKNGEITNVYRESDKVMIGKSYIAPWQGGFGTTLSWKGLSLSAQFSWVADRWMINNDRYFEESNGLFTIYNQSKRLLYDRWKKPGDITDIPRYGVTPYLDSRFLENASFLRLKNISLSYTLPKSWMQKTHFIGNARIYAQGQNLLTFTGFSGLDPESSFNVYKAQYPMSRQFSFGVELSF